MSFEELFIYLKHLQAESLPFSREEINEPLITAYDIIEWALRDQCAVIEISPRRVTWKKEVGGQAIGKFPTPVSFKPYFEMIAKRDPVVQTHLHLRKETDSTATYCIT
jgi:hypothetical protein